MLSTLWVIVLMLMLSCRICPTLSKHTSDVGLNTIQMAENHGYKCTNHDIITKDGYILTYQRIPHGLTNTGSSKKPPVLLMHGIFFSSNEYLDMGPKYGLGYILADLGYDVWLANARGTSWSRNHKTLDISADSKKFFDFSWHEIGYYDLPAAIDYILNITQMNSLYYIGHSQGGTAFLVFASTRPEYAEKIKLALLVAPASFMNHEENEILKPLGENIYELTQLVNALKIYEVPFIGELQKLLPSLCALRELFAICRLINYLSGSNQLTPEIRERLPVIMSHIPSHAATKQLFHYGQLIRNGGFRQYDYGVQKNRQIYKQRIPPNYDLSKISIPVAVFYSEGDRIVNYKDVKMLTKKLSNVIHEYFGPPALGHTEFVFVKDIIDPIDGELIKVLKTINK